MIKVCFCGEQFKIRPSRIKIGKGKYCSRRCYEIAKVKRVDIECKFCGDFFQEVPSHIKRGRGQYCSIACRNQARQIRINKTCLICKSDFQITPNQIIHKIGLYCSKSCAARSRIKEKSHFWRGGVCRPNLKIRSSFEYKQWKKQVLARDQYQCIWCKKTTNLQVDHIKPFAKYPSLRLVVSNGRVLCIDCHKKTDTYAPNLRYA